MNSPGSGSRHVLVIVPSIRISGGIKETLRLAEELRLRGIQIRILSLWKDPRELPHLGLEVDHLSNFAPTRLWAPVQLPILFLRFIGYIRRAGSIRPGTQIALLMTHYSTFPFAWLAPGCKWYCFNQDVEWMFVKGLRRTLLRRIILATSRRAEVVTTNNYIDNRYRDEGIQSLGEAAIWASDFWLSDAPGPGRDIDVAMLLRRGHMKRSDLYLDMLVRLKAAGISSAVVTPDPEIYDRVRKLAGHCLLRPSDDELKAVFQRSRVFLLLSETEGFALPPLEAMGSGCVPLCRDSGGPRCYMQGALAANLLPLSASGAEILQRLIDLLSDAEQISSLSREARQRFKAGFAATAATREECLAKLTVSLIPAPPAGDAQVV
jgi:glycosyltransferase involved in cell wall biosynthesis